MTAPRLPQLTGLLDAAAREGVAPALAAEVRLRGAVVHRSHHGQAQRLPAARPLGADDLFDVASLTKVMATASLAALIVDAGALELDLPAARLLPELGPDHRGITLRHLLAHASGLPAWRPLHAAGRGSAALIAAAAATPLEAAPGTRALYSDLGFILVGAALERAVGAPLDALFAARISGPLALGDTFFVRQGDPVSATRRARHRFAAARATTERGVLVGEVDDDNAFAMGGVAGHAGLFSSASEVAALGQAWLDALAGRSRWLSAATAARFVARDSTPGTERALGWDTPSAQGSSLGTRLGRGRRGAVGHLGFTGCSLWLDLDRELACALLTNHVHPDGPDKPRLKALRVRFHDAVAAELGF